MEKKRREEIIALLKKEKKQYEHKLREVQILFRELKDMEHDGHISKEVKKYIDKYKLEAGARLYMQLIADVSRIILAVEEGETNVDCLGQLYDGEMYPELFDIIEKVGFEHRGISAIIQFSEKLGLDIGALVQ